MHVNKVQQLPKVLLLFTILILSTFLTVGYYYHHPHFRFAAAAQREEDAQHEEDDILPIVNDPNLKVEQVFKGLRFPTKMAFLGP
ncbi:MAG: hypothetical protein ACJ71I_02655, partial [Nitrososphaeraceae archaeon]